MSSVFWPGLLLLCGWFAVIPPAGAEEQTFATLLAQAEEQAAAGHRWAPPGDNMTETVADMMQLIATATPEQLARLAALLDEPEHASALEPPKDTQADSGSHELTLPPEPSGSVSQANSPTTKPTAAAGKVPVPSDKASTTAVVLPAAPGAAPVTDAASRDPVASPSVTAPEPPAPIGSGTAFASARPTPPLATSVPSIAPAVPNTTAPVSTRPSAPPSQLALHPGPRARDLFVRGMQAEQQGDVSAARRFYASAANQGEATAARNLGRLYDPAYLKQTAFGGIDANPNLARHWYEQAVTMGDAEAGPLLDALSMR